jgi:signal transduction histidine kinase
MFRVSGAMNQAQGSALIGRSAAVCEAPAAAFRLQTLPQTCHALRLVFQTQPRSVKSGHYDAPARLAQLLRQTNNTLMSAQCLERSRSRFWNRAAVTQFLVLLALLAMVLPIRARILWSDPDSRVIHATPVGTDILGGAVKRDDKANDALYFKFRVDALSDLANEPYYAVFQLMEGNQYRLAVGNAPEAWGYSACFTSETQTVSRVAGEFDLNSSQPEAAGLGVFKPYELPHHDQKRTIIFKVQYVPGGDDLITVWLSPNLGRGATDENQPANLTTKFKANASFDQIRLRHEGGGNGWIFSDMAIATSFRDFVVVRFWQTWWFASLNAVALLVGVVISVRFIEKRKFQRQLQVANQERALERERARIAQDLHDDLGSSLARISLLSNLVRADLQNPHELESHVAKIAQSADETVRALEEIVWAVRPGSDTLQSLVEYIAHFANELFDGNLTRCRLDLPHDLPDRTLPPDVRHNIFLIVKEALTNVLKHASASEVLVQARVIGRTLEILVQDNGQGFDSAKLSQKNVRHGLENMRRRSAVIGGTLTMQSKVGGGTTVLLTLNFPAWKPPAVSSG